VSPMRSFKQHVCISQPSDRHTFLAVTLQDVKWLERGVMRGEIMSDGVEVNEGVTMLCWGLL